MGHEKVLSELKDHKNTLKILKENMVSDGDGIFTIHSQMSELKNKLFESEKNVEDLKMELSEAKKHQQQELPVDINKQLMSETETENNNSAEVIPIRISHFLAEYFEFTCTINMYILYILYHFFRILTIYILNGNVPL